MPEAFGLLTDSLNNIYVTGGFKNYSTFDTMHININPNYGIYIAKYDSSANIQWVNYGYGNTGISNPSMGISKDAAGNFYITSRLLASYKFGTINIPYAPQFKVMIAKLGFPFNFITDSEDLNQIYIYIYPNPSLSEISITIQKQIKQVSFIINNVLGQTVFIKNENNLSSNYTETIDLSFLSKGIYFLDINIDGERTVKKIVKE